MRRVGCVQEGRQGMRAHPRVRANQRHTEVRTFATTTNALLQLRDWLMEQRVTLVAMEATGDYWRSPFYLLEDDLDVLLVNPAHAKGATGAQVRRHRLDVAG